MRKNETRIVEDEILEHILNIVSEAYKVSIPHLKGNERIREYVEPRKIILALGYSFTANSQKAVGYVYGGKDHAMVNYSVRKVVDYYETEGAFKNNIEKIIDAINMVAETAFSIQMVYDAKNRNKGKSPLMSSPAIMLSKLTKELFTTAKFQDYDFYITRCKKLYKKIQLKKEQLEKANQN